MDSLYMNDAMEEIQDILAPTFLMNAMLIIDTPRHKTNN